MYIYKYSYIYIFFYVLTTKTNFDEGQTIRPLGEVANKSVIVGKINKIILCFGVNVFLFVDFDSSRVLSKTVVYYTYVKII